jgi:hypothetical protein
MELVFTFTGIHTGEGLYPRACIAVTAADADVPTTLAQPRIDITLPLSAKTLDAPYPAVAAAALHTARQLLHGSALADWLAAQA